MDSDTNDPEYVCRYHYYGHRFISLMPLSWASAVFWLTSHALIPLTPSKQKPESWVIPTGGASQIPLWQRVTLSTMTGGPLCPISVLSIHPSGVLVGWDDGGRRTKMLICVLIFSKTTCSTMLHWQNTVFLLWKQQCLNIGWHAFNHFQQLLLDIYLPDGSLWRQSTKRREVPAAQSSWIDKHLFC